MKRQLVSIFGTSAIVILALMVLGQPLVFGQDINEADGLRTERMPDSLRANSVGAKALSGAWNATITMRVCPTGAAIRSFPAMYAFERGGTMHESSPGNAPLPRSPGYGTWSHLSEGSYYASYQIYRFNADGTYAGTVKARKYYQVDFLENNFTATGTFQLFDVNGALVGAGCLTETGTRFEN